MKKAVCIALILCILASGMSVLAEEEKGFFGSIGDSLDHAWNAASGAVSDGLDAAGEAAGKAWDAASEVAGEAWDATSEAAGKAWDATSDAAGKAWNATSNAVRNAWYKAGETVKGIWNNETGEFEPQESGKFMSPGESDPNMLKFYMGMPVNTGTDNGYSKDNEIKGDDPHFGWSLGNFYVCGFTRVMEDEQGNPVFMKTVGDTVELHFELYQDIDKLNGSAKLSINKDANGFDERMGIPKTDFGRGVMITRHTDYTNLAQEPTIYTDFLSARAGEQADTTVDLFEEGDYEIALDYEIKDAAGLLSKYTNYRIAFKFSVRNGNCMVYPFDIATGAELTNTAVTENGFYLDLARSRYLDINIKKQVLMEGANGLTEDTRFNRPAKDGDQYTDEGIYIITACNRYTQQETEILF